MAGPEKQLEQLAGCFLQTLAPNPEPRKQAEAFLKHASGQPGYGMLVLQLVASSADEQIRQAAGVNFKNHIKYHWAPPETDSSEIRIQDVEKEQIKGLITGLMLSTPPKIQAQLSEALAIISNTEFPKNWPNLLPELISKLQTTDYSVINGVLQTANSIFKRFRFQYKSDELYVELKYVLDLFVPPMLDLFKRTTQLIGSSSRDGTILRPLFDCQRLTCRIFFSLNSQELPEVFEDHLPEWMGEFHTYLVYENPVFEEDSEKESAVDQVKAAICQNVNMYMEKNEEEFQAYLPTFVSDVWNLLMKVGLSTSHDKLATTAIRFLTTVAKSVHHTLFSDPETLKKICENIVIPNIRIRDEDEELFDMNHVEYIRRDMEGSDTDTRRRMACELVKGLASHYEAQVTGLFGGYVGAMLQQYATNPGENWKAKDCAIYLVVALAVKQKTAAQGATATNQLVNVAEFFTTQIQPELQSPQGSAVLKADSLKFLTTFRSQIPKEACMLLMPNLIGLLTTDQNVVHTYAAHAIERMLVLKDGGRPRYTAQDMAPYVQQLLTNLFNALKLPDSAENDYVMKCIMRLIGQAEVMPYATDCLQQLAGILNNVYKNPTHPGFNHYIFEALAALIHHCCLKDRSMAARFEEVLFPIFQNILQEDVTEFHPYVFQILSLLVEERSPPLPPAYMAIFRPLLTPVMWERVANVPALVRLLQAYLHKAPSEVISGNHLPAVLGIFQKLVASRHNDHNGFFVLNAVVENLPFQVLSQYLPTVWQILFYRLQNSRTIKFGRALVIFMSLFVAKHGATEVVESVNSVQPGIFNMLLESVWVHKDSGVAGGDASTITGPTEVKLCAVASAKLLTEAPQLLSDGALPLWGKLLETVILLLERTDEEKERAENDEAEASEIDEISGYTATYAHLHNAHKHDEDPVPEVGDVRQYLATQLAKTSASMQGKLRAVISSSLSVTSQAALGGYCQKYGVAIA